MNFILFFYILELKIILYQATYTNISESDWYLSLKIDQVYLNLANYRLDIFKLNL